MLDHLNANMREFVGEQEMFFLATADAEGECDNTFRAGPPGFLRVLDKKTLVFPEYRGNGVHASLGNIEENPHLGIILVDFFRARIGLHINGKARIVPDAELREQHQDLPVETVPGRRAELWVQVTVEEAYIHCAKHIPQLQKAPKGTPRDWGTDDAGRKGGDFFGVSRDRTAAGSSSKPERAPAPVSAQESAAVSAQVSAAGSPAPVTAAATEPAPIAASEYGPEPEYGPASGRTAEAGSGSWAAAPSPSAGPAPSAGNPPAPGFPPAPVSRPVRAFPSAPSSAVPPAPPFPAGRPDDRGGNSAGSFGENAARVRRREWTGAAGPPHVPAPPADRPTTGWSADTDAAPNTRPRTGPTDDRTRSDDGRTGPTDGRYGVERFGRSAESAESAGTPVQPRAPLVPPPMPAAAPPPARERRSSAAEPPAYAGELPPVEPSAHSRRAGPAELSGPPAGSGPWSAPHESPSPELEPGVQGRSWEHGPSTAREHDPSSGSGAGRTSGSGLGDLRVRGPQEPPAGLPALPPLPLPTSGDRSFGRGNQAGDAHPGQSALPVPREHLAPAPVPSVWQDHAAWQAPSDRPARQELPGRRERAAHVDESAAVARNRELMPPQPVLDWREEAQRVLAEAEARGPATVRDPQPPDPVDGGGEELSADAEFEGWFARTD
ncbi:pyridoxamine 5'-phosphate oxidase family protein [Streptomyces sp. P38-E01]|uniref:Pyridoxamine 5'-phosphate oxidase family protein n=2 Tax=Streptomyces tardus TaxID=2780544 RepID=A0A949JFW3_9ACTN|nr:pyridoxamine 5'-phosphate oxidase family protein [Streptomyces tardus]